jgi:hypothetical protein
MTVTQIDSPQDWPDANAIQMPAAMAVPSLRPKRTAGGGRASHPTVRLRERWVRVVKGFRIRHGAG